MSLSQISIHEELVDNGHVFVFGVLNDASNARASQICIRVVGNRDFGHGLDTMHARRPRQNKLA